MTLLEMIKDECGGLSIREMMVVRAVVGIFAGAVGLGTQPPKEIMQDSREEKQWRKATGESRSGTSFLCSLNWPFNINVNEGEDGILITFGKRGESLGKKVFGETEPSKPFGSPVNDQFIVVEVISGGPTGEREPIKNSPHGVLIKFVRGSHELTSTPKIQK